MIHLLAIGFGGVVFMLLAGWGKRRIVRQIEAEEKRHVREFQKETEISRKILDDTIESVKTQLEILRRADTETSELDRMILEDAINRERRAKHALVAVLKTNRVPENEIEKLLQMVDNEQDFDWSKL